MQLKCKYCAKVKTSMIIGDDISAFKELSEKIIKHITLKHPSELIKIREYITSAQMLMGAYLSISETIDIDSDMTSEFIIEEFNKTEDKIMDLVGYEVTDSVEEFTGKTEEEIEKIEENLEKEKEMEFCGGIGTEFLKKESD